MSGTPNPIFGSVLAMREVDAKAFGARIGRRREELGLSQADLAALVGYKQQNIDWIEAGKPKRPKRYAIDFAEALQTTADWLLWGEGPRAAGPQYLPVRAIVELYEAMSPEEKARISREFDIRPPRRKSG